jgi:hypothetical protein
MLQYILKLLKSLLPMGIKFGEIDADQILDNEYRSKLAMKILAWMMNHPTERPTQQMFDGWKNEVIRELQIKYPNSGVTLDE